MLGFLTSPNTETVILSYVAYQFLSALVQSLPQPSEYGGVWYKAAINFLSIVVADYKSFVKLPSTTVSAQTVSAAGTTTIIGTTTSNSSPISTPSSSSIPNSNSITTL